MHRITKLTIENYRAFYGSYSLDLPSGENLLLYGENGSGKSSLLLAIREWMESSNLDWKLSNFESQTNFFTEQGAKPVIDIRIEDFLPSTGEINPWVSQTLIGSYRCEATSTRTSRNSVVTLQWERHGFLTYRTLLQTYLVKDNNLFDLIVNGILGNIKIGGGAKSIRQRWKELTALKTMNKSQKLKDGIKNDIPGFNGEVGALIQQSLQPIVNGILSHFFKESKIKIAIGTPNLMLSPHRVKRANGSSARLFSGKEIKIGVDISETPVPQYETTLNEARLNAIAIALFLAGRIIHDEVARNHSGILLLDDIFIGLDTSNRIPLLQLLTSKSLNYVDSNGIEKTCLLFQEYQIIVSTYDRYWFNVAREWLGQKSKGQWESYEMYAYTLGSNRVGLNIDQPILKCYENNLGTGIRYFRDKFNPDYTASATFFRKAAEELLNRFLPDKLIEEVKKNKRKDDEDPEPKPVFLKDYIAVSKAYLTQLGEPNDIFDDLRGHLRTLLNPLSHFEREQSPIFRKELEEILVILQDKLPPFLDSVKSRVREVLPRNSKIRIRFQFGRRHIGYYELLTGNDLYIIKDSASGKYKFSGVSFTISSGVENNNHTIKTHKNKPPKTDLQSIKRIEDAYNYLVGVLPTASTMPNYIDACKFVQNNKVRPLKDLLF